MFWNHTIHHWTGIVFHTVLLPTKRIKDGKGRQSIQELYHEVYGCLHRILTNCPHKKWGNKLSIAKVIPGPRRKIYQHHNGGRRKRTTSDQPVYSRSYPDLASLNEEVERQITKLLSNGIIRSSKSPYNASVWIVPKTLDAFVKRKFQWDLVNPFLISQPNNSSR